MLYRINAGRIPPDHWVQDPHAGAAALLGSVPFVDYMQALCGALPTTVFAGRVGYHSSGITEDQCSITLTFGDGSIGTILYAAEGNAGLPKERFEAHADGRSLVMDDFMETSPCTKALATAPSRRRNAIKDLRKKWRRSSMPWKLVGRRLSRSTRLKQSPVLASWQSEVCSPAPGILSSLAPFQLVFFHLQTRP